MISQSYLFTNPAFKNMTGHLTFYSIQYHKSSIDLGNSFDDINYFWIQQINNHVETRHNWITYFKIFFTREVFSILPLFGGESLSFLCDLTFTKNHRFDTWAGFSYMARTLTIPKSTTKIIQSSEKDSQKWNWKQPNFRMRPVLNLWPWTLVNDWLTH